MTTPRRARATAVVLGAALTTAVVSADVGPLPDPHRLRLSEAFHLVETLGPDVWPGFDGRNAPVVLSVGDIEYLLNRADPLPGFRAVPDDRFHGHPVFARKRVFAPALLATFPVEGVTSVVMGTAEMTGRTPTRWVLTVAHELFHVYQAERGLDGKVLDLAIGPPDRSDWHLDFPFPYDDQAVQNAMHLLGHGLFRVLERPASADAGAVLYDARVAHEALENLFLVLDLRFEEPRHARYFRYQTGKEGVARYVEYNLARLAATGYEPFPPFAEAEGRGTYRSAWSGHFESGLINTVKHAGRVSRSRLEFYSLGLGLALVLDRLEADWKERLFEDGMWLDDLLHRAVEGNTGACLLP